MIVMWRAPIVVEAIYASSACGWSQQYRQNTARQALVCARRKGSGGRRPKFHFFSQTESHNALRMARVLLVVEFPKQQEPRTRSTSSRACFSLAVLIFPLWLPCYSSILCKISHQVLRNITAGAANIGTIYPSVGYTRVGYPGTPKHVQYPTKHTFGPFLSHAYTWGEVQYTPSPVWRS